MAKVDIAFALLAQQPIPADHGYVLYGALSRTVPLLHSSNGIGVHPIRGQQIGDRRLSVTSRSRLVLRVDTENISAVLPLAGKQLDVAGARLHVGVPQVWALQPSTALRSRMVTTKNCQEQSRFELELRRQLDDLLVSPEVIVTIPKRRTLRIKDKEVVGYEVILEGLTAEESLAVQQVGLGGRRHMGCGVFVPKGRPQGDSHE
jgi:CRISPR-associated protein Cas6